MVSPSVQGTFTPYLLPVRLAYPPSHKTPQPFSVGPSCALHNRNISSGIGNAFVQRWVNWRMWLTSQGIHSPVETRSIQINNYPMVLQSARNGMGIALGWRHLVDDMIQAKELVVPVPYHMHTDNGYYLLIREAVPVSPGAQAFRQWALEEQAAHGGGESGR